MSLSNIILNNFMKDFGGEAVAALSIAMKVNMLIVFVRMGTGMGIQPLIGYSFGARNMERLRKTMRFTMLWHIYNRNGLTIILLYFHPADY